MLNADITNCQFNSYIDEFNELLLQNLCLVLSQANSELEIINNYKKELKPINNTVTKSYLLTRIRLTSPCFNECLILDFTISYDDFYLAPVLYFRAFKSAGRSNTKSNEEPTISPIMSLEELASDYNSVLGIRDSTTFNISVTLDSHHLIVDSSVWFYVHPCETVGTLRDFMRDGFVVEPIAGQDPVLEYLIIWFGTYGLSGLFPYISFRPALHTK